MAGVKGRSGRRPLPVDVLLLRGTFRPDRHGSRAAALALVERTRTGPPPADVPHVPDALIAGLEARGCAFVTELWTMYDQWTPAARTTLHELGGVVDALARLEALCAREPADAPPDLALARLRLATLRGYALLLTQLDLKG